MKKHSAEELLIKYLNGHCTPEEKVLVESGFLQHLKTNKETISEEEVDDAVARMRVAIDARIDHHRIPRKGNFSFWRLSIAASLLIFAGVSWFFILKPRADKNAPKSNYVNDVKPGGNKAYLTLENGTRITLDDAADGKLAEQSGIIITKSHDGQLIYTIVNPTADISLSGNNIIETPRSGKYQVNLPDGSKVWLNAASKLTYPVRFSGNVRRVKCEGEAYFEVSPNKAMPFQVETRSQLIEVLGTHFNINAYSDEPVIRTTLIEGSVLVKPDQSTGLTGKLLKPGEESLLSPKGIEVQSADIESVTSWKNGDFIFRGETLASIMRKVSKWYDVDVYFEKGSDQDLIFSGLVSRSKNLSTILKTMELTGKVHFRIEGRRVTIMP
ncbi:MAG TPA: FecR domain-containing protein [Sphingobacteriaceae bacterium]